MESESREELRSRRAGSRREAAARERTIALAALGLVAVVALAAFGWHALARPKSVAAAPATTAATQSSVLASTPALTCPFNGCTASKCHAPLRRGKTRRTTTPHVVASTKASAASAGSGAAHATAAAPKPAPVKVAAAKPAVRKIVASGSSKAAGAASSSAASARGKNRPFITIETFGYSFAGPPTGCRFVADVRNVQAGDFKQSETGLMPSVRARVLAVPAAQTWLRTMRTSWMPKLKNGDMIAIGCARGHHRSVSIAYVFAQDLRAKGYKVVLVHRDISKTW